MISDTEGATCSLYSAEECERIAREAALRYVKNGTPGITRKRSGKGFAYYYPDGSLIKDKMVLTRIKSLAIPPAYQRVWICPYANGHIQATGYDARNRKQYRYHSLWQQERQKNKFQLMVYFGQAIPLIRAHIDEQLNKTLTLSKSQIICAIIYLMDNYYIRIGNTVYARENKSYGLTTLRKKHIRLEKNKATLKFIGKNAKPWHIVLKDRKILRVLKKCEEIPGYELFKYKDENNALNVITSQEINAYLQALTNHSFTAKDFRTWAACRETFKRLIMLEELSENSSLKQVIADVSQLLGHTPAICLKSYIFGDIITCWQEGMLQLWIEEIRRKKENYDDDQLLLLWLQQHLK
ncbi:DNA topoisomerase IB [Legionella dresdenensis]|uniref:DNA topoisomerase n=1 Tax=Legionella dresdenensis TaxID=450200 RepID=A0ABV8CHN6_9GAMM